MLRNLLANLNGVAIAYLLGLVNALLQLLLAFGVSISDKQNAALVAFVNAALVALAHLAHKVGQNTPATPAPAVAPTTLAPPPSG